MIDPSINLSPPREWTAFGGVDDPEHLPAGPLSRRPHPEVGMPMTKAKKISPDVYLGLIARLLPAKRLT